MRSRREVKKWIEDNPEETPTEEMGNFWFVKEFDETLYQKIIYAEGCMKIDLPGAAKGLRDILESFLTPVFQAHPEAEERARQFQRTREGCLPLLARVHVLSDFPDLHINANAAHTVRKTANAGAHYEERMSRHEEFNYRLVRSGMTALHNMLKEYYAEQAETSTERETILRLGYEDDYQPLKDMFVYKVQNGQTGKKNASAKGEKSSGACGGSDPSDFTYEKQYLCFRKTGSRYQYFLVRQYARDMLDSRDTETLNLLWNESIRNPQGIVRYSTFFTRDATDTDTDRKTFVCYQINGRPLLFDAGTIRALSAEQKAEIMSILTEGIYSLHSAGICHRNLQPSAVYAYKIGGRVGVNLINFECSKITGNEKTVFQQAVKNYDENAIFSAPEVRSLHADSDAGHIDWKKADIYSLGMLFAYLMMDGDFQGTVIRNIEPLLKKNPDRFPAGLKELIRGMCSNTPSRRPSIEEIKDKLKI